MALQRVSEFNPFRGGGDQGFAVQDRVGEVLDDDGVTRLAVMLVRHFFERLRAPCQSWRGGLDEFKHRLLVAEEDQFAVFKGQFAASHR